MSDPTTESSRVAQRRHLAILFSDLVDSTALSESMEREDYRELLNLLRPAYEAVLSRHGGILARAQGDGVLAIFGYPSTREDDGRRAAEAALELHALVREFSFSPLPAGASLRLHTGIHAGLVLLEEGDLVRGRFDLAGNAPNIAYRLSSAAGPDEIVVSEETLGAESHFFQTGQRELITLKGRAEPISVYRIRGRAAAMTRFEARERRGLAPFVGRTREMRVLRDHLRAAIGGAPQCVAIAGGPGLGKTRLIAELVRDGAAQCLVLRSYCESYLSAEPLQPFMQMLRTVCGLVPGMPAGEAGATASRSLEKFDRLSETAREALLQAMSLSSQGREARRPTTGATIAALCSLFEALSLAQPLVLIVDDLQWADDASQQMLDALRALPRPIFVVIGTREVSPDTLASATRMTTIELSPLGAEEAAPTIEHFLPGADPFIVDEIHRYAGGNPLFLEELCHSAAARGNLRPLDNRQGGEAWLNALIESRLARLPHEQADIVRTAAVVGNVFPEWLLERITGRREDDPLVRALAEQDFLFPSEQAGTLRFKHGITRDVVYNTVGLHQRKSIHFAVATALAQHGAQSASQDVSEALAYHYSAAGVPVEAARYAELAGDKALAATALDRARIQYLAALAALDQLAPMSTEVKLRWCAVAQKLGMGCVYDPLGLADGVALFERCVALARESGNLEVIARAEYWLGYMCYARGLAREAIIHCKASLDLSLRLGDERLAAQVRATLGQALTSACEYDGALALLDSAIDTKRKQSRPGSSVAVGSAYSLACKGCLLGDRGLFEQAEDCFKEALELLGSSPHQVASSVRGWIAVVYMWQGRWDDALQVAEESKRIADKVRSRQLFAMSQALAGYSSWVLARSPDALHAIRDATSWIEARKGMFSTSLNYGWLVDVAVELGHEAEARRHAARLFMRARQRNRIGEAMGCRALARAAAKAGKFSRAEHYLALAQLSAEVRRSPHEKAKNDLIQAQIDIQRDRPAQAHAPLDAACGAFEAMNMGWYLAQAQQLRAAL